MKKTQKPPKTKMKTFNGSCHCQAIKFKVDLDLSQGIGKCNCTFCYKTGIRIVFVRPQDLKIVSGKSFLQDYPAPEKKHDKSMYFCKQCGVRCFTRCNFEMPPFGAGFYAININSLDDMKPAEIIAAPKHYGDGLHDNWGNPPKEIRHL